MNISKSALKLFSARIINTALGFIGIVIFARQLGSSELGVFFIFQATLGILTIPVDLGVRGAVEKRISEGEDASKILGTAVLFKAVLLIVVATVLYIFRGMLNSYLGSHLTILLIVLLVTQEAALLTGNTLKGELRVGRVADLQVIRQLIWVFIGLLFVYYQFGTVGLIYSLWFSFAIMFIWGAYQMNTGLGRPSWNSFRSLFHYAKFNAIVSNIGSKLYQWLDIVIMGAILSSAAVGAYEIAWRVSLVVMIFSYSLGATILPQISKWDSDQKHGQIESLLSGTLVASLSIVIPAFFGGVVLSEYILRIIFGSEYVVAATALVVLLGAKIIESVYVILERTLQAIDRPDLSAVSMILSLIINATLNIYLIWRFGIIGAAFATLISTLFNTILHLYFINSNIGFKVPYMDIGWCVLSAIIMYGVVHTYVSIYQISTMFSLLFAIAIGVIIYFPLVMIRDSIREQAVKNYKRIF